MSFIKKATLDRYVSIAYHISHILNRFPTFLCVLKMVIQVITTAHYYDRYFIFAVQPANLTVSKRLPSNKTRHCRSFFQKWPGKSEIPISLRFISCAFIGTHKVSERQPIERSRD